MRGLEDRSAEKISIVCPDCVEKDKFLAKGLKLLEDVAKPVEVSRGRVCSFCGNAVKKRKRSLRVDFRYNGTELRGDVCESCLDDNEELNAIYVKPPNPDFNVTIKCNSAGLCESFKKPGKDRGINCGHVVVNMDGELYCRRAHPGHVRVYRERYAFPPSRRQLMKMLTVLSPMFEKFKNGAQLLADEASVAPRKVPIFPDNVEYEIKEFPIEGNKVSLPWNAHIINVIGDQTMAVLVTVEKKEELGESLKFKKRGQNHE